MPQAGRLRNSRSNDVERAAHRSIVVDDQDHGSCPTRFSAHLCRFALPALIWGQLDSLLFSLLMALRAIISLIRRGIFPLFGEKIPLFDRVGN
jgi:hypothetical protein